MKKRYIILTLGLAIFGLFYACTKNTNPSPPVTDTVTITKIDTLTVPPPPDSTVNLTKGLLLYLNFNGSIADSSGNNNPTEAIGGNVLTYDAHGYANSAFGGNGTGQEIVVTNNGSIEFDTAFTLSYDFMINVSARQAMVSMINISNGNGPSFLASTSIVGIPNLDFGVSDVSQSCESAAVGVSPNIGDTSFIPQLNTWYNVINIYHKGSIATYVNGQLNVFTQGTGTAALLCPESQIVIGGWWNGDPITLNGKMDEVRLYNRVLTPHEIVTLSQHFQVTSESVQRKVTKG
jgi:hypothetical protein